MGKEGQSRLQRSAFTLSVLEPLRRHRGVSASDTQMNGFKTSNRPPDLSHRPATLVSALKCHLGLSNSGSKT